LKLGHLAGSSEANDDVVARLQFAGADNAHAEELTGRIDSVIRDITAANPDSDMLFYVDVAGTETLRFELPYDLNGVLVGSGAAQAFVASSGVYTLTLATNANGTGASIDLESGTDSDVILKPSGTGVVRGGSAGAACTITSSGAYDLILETNDGTNAGTLTFTDGANGDITFACNGSGAVVIPDAAIRYQHRDVAAATATDAPDATDGLIQYGTDGATDCTVTLPECASNLGLVLTFQHDVDGGKNVVLTRTGADTIDEAADTGNTTYTMANAGEWIQIMAVADNIWAVIAKCGGTLA
jgi:hypothetical protein